MRHSHSLHTSVKISDGKKIPLGFPSEISHNENTMPEQESLNVASIYMRQPTTVDENTLVSDVIKLMYDNHFNSVSVINAQQQLVGVLSMQDIAAATVPSEFQDNPHMAAAMYKPNFFEEMCQSIHQKQVKDLMRKEFVTVTPDANIMEITAEFLQGDLYVVPVVDKGRMVGVITRSEITKAFMLAMGTHE